jgi:hypothetical protein
MKAQHEQERRKSRNPLYPTPQNSSDVTITRKSEKTQRKKNTPPTQSRKTPVKKKGKCK